MCGDASVPCLASPVFLLIIGSPACGRLAATGPPMCGDASVPCLTSPVLLLIRRNPACGRPVCAWDASVPCLAPLVLLLLKRESTCDRPSYVRGRICPLSDLSRLLINKKKPFLRPAWGRVCPCLAPLVLLLSKKEPTCDRPSCVRGRVCPLSGLSRPLINNKKPCLRPACLSVGTRLYPILPLSSCVGTRLSHVLQATSIVCPAHKTKKRDQGSAWPRVSL